jgi:hypothetical protein
VNVFWVLYGDPIWWLTSMLVFVTIGFWGGYKLGKEYRQPRDAKGRFARDRAALLIRMFKFKYEGV